MPTLQRNPNSSRDASNPNIRIINHENSINRAPMAALSLAQKSSGEATVANAVESEYPTGAPSIAEMARALK